MSTMHLTISQQYDQRYINMYIPLKRKLNNILKFHEINYFSIVIIRFKNVSFI